MLKVYFGTPKSENYYYKTSLYFDLNYEDEWITSDFARMVIHDVDKSEVVSPRIIDSPVLGAITPKELAGGTKTVLLMYFEPDKIFNASACGDNCAKWILKIGESTDLTIRLGHVMDFPEPFRIQILNDDSMVDNFQDFLLKGNYFLSREAD